MTDASTTGAVERFDPYTDEGNREGYGEMEVQAARRAPINSATGGST